MADGNSSRRSRRRRRRRPRRSRRNNQQQHTIGAEQEFRDQNQRRSGKGKDDLPNVFIYTYTIYKSGD
jgi:hypothetical protein